MEQSIPKLYYWQNYRFLLQWVLDRYDDLLSVEEQQYAAQFVALPQAAQALLVRLLMRKGTLFRGSKLRYQEIGDTAKAVAPLIDLGWVIDNPPIGVEDLWRQLLKSELHQHLRVPKTLSKAASLPWLVSSLPQEQLWRDYVPDLQDDLYQLQMQALSDSFRLMFFGNASQELTEFVVSDLGLVRYETVDFPEAARAFHCRDDLDLYWRMHLCAQCLDEQQWQEAIALLPEPQPQNPWLHRRRDKLCYRLAYHLERQGQLEEAMQLYQSSQYPGSRVRQIRILMAQGAFEQAWQAWQLVMADDPVESDRQALERMAPRLAKKVGAHYDNPKATIEEQWLETEPLAPGESVETRAAALLTRPDHPVFYVENGLITGLFGLWCWPALFAPVQGAFFHPFQLGPADLYQPDFEDKRQPLFDALWQLFESETGSNSYRQAILACYRDKQGIANPFVNWNLLTPTLLEQALDCMPAPWLKALFKRLLSDVRANRSGFPDLVQFHPDQASLTLIEVKGPGDVLQDNQKRWMAAFSRIGIPHRVVYVRW